MIGEIQFYKQPEKDYRKRRDLGQFFLAPMPFLLHSTVPRLKLDYYDKAKPYNSSYTIENVSIESFQPEDVEPIHPLKLSTKDFVICLAHKLRPVIILSPQMPSLRDFKKTPYASCYLVAPIYTTKDEAGNYKFSEEFLLRVQAYEYPTLFYLPEDSESGIKESIVRLERVAAINGELLRPMPVSLHEDSLYCLTEWFHHFLGAELNEMLSLYREAALERLNEIEQ